MKKIFLKLCMVGSCFIPCVTNTAGNVLQRILIGDENAAQQKFARICGIEKSSHITDAWKTIHSENPENIKNFVTPENFQKIQQKGFDTIRQKSYRGAPVVPIVITACGIAYLTFSLGTRIFPPKRYSFGTTLTAELAEGVFGMLGLMVLGIPASLIAGGASYQALKMINRKVCRPQLLK